ncbi:Gfo/Idh/MocA family oxidoreductase [Yimella sp. cx-573]|nr:Gfo/Idh/MocA family oxidoreductase [Yimella sp. cx-573]
MRAGLAGYGLAGRHIHRPQLKAAGFEIAAVSTRNPERVAEVEREEPQAQVVPDLDALLQVPDLDLIVLATPTGMHVDHLRAAIAAAVPIVVDKPITPDAESAQQAVAAAAAAGCPLTVFQNRRWDTPHLAAKKLLADGSLGELVRYEFRWERWRPEPKARWREQDSAADGGGLLLDLGAHLVDSAVDLFGPVDSVVATMASHTTAAEDQVVMMCRHAGGVVSHLSTTSLAGVPGPRLRLSGTKAAYVVTEFEAEPNGLPGFENPAGHVGWLCRGDDREALPTVAPERTFYEQVADALNSDDPQAKMPVDPRDSVHVARVLDAARRAAQNWQVTQVEGP